MSKTTPPTNERTLEEHLRSDIESGALVKKEGLSSLLKTLRAQLPKRTPRPAFLKNKKAFEEKIAEIVWTPKIVEHLRNFVRHGVTAERFHELHPYIPLPMIEGKVRQFTGVTRYATAATLLHGIGRLHDGRGLKPVEFQKTSCKAPYDSGIRRSKWAVRMLNGVNLGVRYDRLIEENPTRIALAHARRMGDDCVVITNLFDLDIRAGGGRQKILRSLVSGQNIGVSVLDPEYQPRAKELLKDSDRQELIYATPAELFQDLLAGWNRVAVKHDGPEFNRRIFIILGLKEDQLIAGAAAWETRYFTVLRHNQILAEIRAVRNAIGESDNEVDIARLEEELETLVREEVRTRISNVTPAEDRRIYEQMRAAVVKEIEKAIPNSTVIGQGTTFVKFGDKVVEFVIPGHLRVTDTLLADFTNHCGPQVTAGEMPDTVVICHPYATGYHERGIQRDADGVTHSSFACVAPVCLDADFLRDELRETIGNPHPVAKLVKHAQFDSGVLRLSELHGIVNADVHTVRELLQLERRIIAKKLVGSDAIGNCKYIWIMLDTDPHFGGQQKMYVTDPESGRRLGMGGAFIEILRRGGFITPEKMPIHFYSMNDDPTQGQHFQNWTKTDPRRQSSKNIEMRILGLLAAMHGEKDPGKRGELEKRMAQFAMRQLEVRGDAWVQDQMVQVLERHIEPNLDFFDAVLRRGIGAGLEMRGRSSFVDSPEDAYDARDLGFVDFGTGNHLLKTVLGALTEGEFYARSLQDKLQRFPYWAGKGALLEKLIKAPQYSGTNIGWGLVKAPGGYEWGLDFRSTPTGLGVNWGDPLLNCVRNDERRGNYSYIFNGRAVIKTYGDKHFRNKILTAIVKYILGMPGVPTDAFGELGFPPNNTGVTVVGAPKDGPDAGPFLIRCMHDDQIRRYFAKPYRFDVAEFLRNPV